MVRHLNSDSLTLSTPPGGRTWWPDDPNTLQTATGAIKSRCQPSRAASAVGSSGWQACKGECSTHSRGESAGLHRQNTARPPIDSRPIMRRRGCAPHFIESEIEFHRIRHNHLQKTARPPMGSRAIMRPRIAGRLGLPSVMIRNCGSKRRCCSGIGRCMLAAGISIQRCSAR